MAATTSSSQVPPAYDSVKDKPSVEEYRAMLPTYDKLVAEAKKSDRCQTYMLSEQPKEVMRSFESLIGNVKLYS
jgi:hypothetical protein